MNKVSTHGSGSNNLTQYAGSNFKESVYFIMNESEKKCFLEEIPEDTLVMGNYKIETFDRESQSYISSPEIGTQVEVSDPDGTNILSKLYTLDGKFSFTSAIAGEHQICLYPVRTDLSQRFGSARLRVHLTLESGEHAMDYRALVELNKFNELQLRVQQLLDQVQKMQKEQNYQRVREERFRQSSESTNQKVVWWAFAQVVVLVSVCYWQLRHLKWFFKAKKII